MSLNQEKGNELLKIYCIVAISDMVFILPILMVFLRSFGLTFFHLTLLQAAYSITLMIFEVPSGVFADLYGKKKALIIFFLLWDLGLLLYSLGTTLEIFILAESILGIGTAFLSGTLIALTYEILERSGCVDKATKVFGNIQAISISSSFVAYVIGGLIAKIDLRLPFWITLSTFLLGTLICSTLPKVEISDSFRESKSKSLVKHLTDALTLLRHSPSLLTLVFIIASLTCLFTISFWLWQPYLQDIGVGIEFFGIIYGANVVSTVIGARLSYLIEKHVNEKIFLLIFPSMVGVSFIVLGLFPYIVTVVVMIQFQQIMKGIGNPILTKIINMHAPNDIRTTLLSIVNLLGRLQFAIVSPVIGFIADMFSLPFTLILCGILAFMIIMFYYIFEAKRVTSI